jgi:hypothetical protein
MMEILAELKKYQKKLFEEIVQDQEASKESIKISLLELLNEILSQLNLSVNYAKRIHYNNKFKTIDVRVNNLSYADPKPEVDDEPVASVRYGKQIELSFNLDDLLSQSKDSLQKLRTVFKQDDIEIVDDINNVAEQLGLYNVRNLYRIMYTICNYTNRGINKTTDAKKTIGSELLKTVKATSMTDMSKSFLWDYFRDSKLFTNKNINLSNYSDTNKFLNVYDLASTKLLFVNTFNSYVSINAALGTNFSTAGPGSSLYTALYELLNKNITKQDFMVLMFNPAFTPRMEKVSLPVFDAKHALEEAQEVNEPDGKTTEKVSKEAPKEIAKDQKEVSKGVSKDTKETPKDSKEVKEPKKELLVGEKPAMKELEKDISKNDADLKKDTNKTITNTSKSSSELLRKEVYHYIQYIKYEMLKFCQMYYLDSSTKQYNPEPQQEALVVRLVNQLQESYEKESEQKMLIHAINSLVIRDISKSKTVDFFNEQDLNEVLSDNKFKEQVDQYLNADGSIKS